MLQISAMILGEKVNVKYISKKHELLLNSWQSCFLFCTMIVNMTFELNVKVKYTH